MNFKHADQSSSDEVTKKTNHQKSKFSFRRFATNLIPLNCFMLSEGISSPQDPSWGFEYLSFIVCWRITTHFYYYWWYRVQSVSKYFPFFQHRQQHGFSPPQNIPIDQWSRKSWRIIGKIEICRFDVVKRGWSTSSSQLGCFYELLLQSTVVVFVLIELCGHISWYSNPHHPIKIWP